VALAYAAGLIEVVAEVHEGALHEVEAHVDFATVS
jgi:hypothetical protein